MPGRAELPAAIRQISRRQAVRVDHSTFRSNIESLIDAIIRTTQTVHIAIPPPDLGRVLFVRFTPTQVQIIRSKGVQAQRILCIMLGATSHDKD